MHSQVGQRLIYELKNIVQRINLEQIVYYWLFSFNKCNIRVLHRIFSYRQYKSKCSMLMLSEFEVGKTIKSYHGRFICIIVFEQQIVNVKM